MLALYRPVASQELLLEAAIPAEARRPDLRSPRHTVSLLKNITMYHKILI